MTRPHHVWLPVLDAPNGGREEVEVEPLDGASFRVRCPPRFVDGLAVDDEIELDDSVPAGFRVLRHSGNLTVRFYVAERGDEHELARRVASDMQRIGAVVEGTPPRMLIVTASIAIGWASIAAAMDAAAATVPGVCWEYANVYDPLTNEPLGWWNAR